MLTSICTSKVYKKNVIAEGPWFGQSLLFFTFNSSEVLPRLTKMTYCKPLLTSTEQALRGALAAGREKEGELATTSLEFEFRLQFPVAPLYCGKESEKHVPRVMTSLLMSSPPISISHRLFRCRINFQRGSRKFSFLFPPRRQSAPQGLVAGYLTGL